jgi:hypothetical protein
MENQNPNQESLKEREYEEIQNRATKSGHLEDIHTHESNDIVGIMSNARRQNSNPPTENPENIGINNSDSNPS